MEIKQSFYRYGHNFELYTSELVGKTKADLKRYRAIYLGKSEEGNINIEVVILREMPPEKMFHKDGNWIKYPSTSEWGVFGWTYNVMAQAVNRYNTIPSILTDILH